MTIIVSKMNALLATIIRTGDSAISAMAIRAMLTSHGMTKYFKEVILGRFQFFFNLVVVNRPRVAMGKT